MFFPLPPFLPASPQQDNPGPGQQDGSSRAHTSHVVPEAQPTPSAYISPRRHKGLMCECGGAGVQAQRHPWKEGLPWGKQREQGVMVHRAVMSGFSMELRECILHTLQLTRARSASDVPTTAAITPRNPVEPVHTRMKSKCPLPLSRPQQHFLKGIAWQADTAKSKWVLGAGYEVAEV